MATAVETIKKSNDNLHTWNIPAVVIFSSADTYTDWKGSEELVAGIASKDKGVEKYDRGLHELWHDL